MTDTQPMTAEEALKLAERIENQMREMGRVRLFKNVDKLISTLRAYPDLLDRQSPTTPPVGEDVREAVRNIIVEIAADWLNPDSEGIGLDDGVDRILALIPGRKAKALDFQETGKCRFEAKCLNGYYSLHYSTGIDAWLVTLPTGEELDEPHSLVTDAAAAAEAHWQQAYAEAGE